MIRTWHKRIVAVMSIVDFGENTDIFFRLVLLLSTGFFHYRVSELFGFRTGIPSLAFRSKAGGSF